VKGSRLRGLFPLVPDHFFIKKNNPNMSKFTISLFGRGSEVNVHTVTQEQRERLEHLNLNDCILEDVANILELKDELNLVESDEIYVGAYQENSQIVVYDESNREIYSEDCEKLINHEMVSPNGKVDKIYQESKLYVNDYIKGNIFNIEIEDDKFHISQLEFNFIDIEGLYMIYSISYEKNESYIGDYWSKGIVYFLSQD
jgi:hypothetical protein